MSDTLNENRSVNSPSVPSTTPAKSPQIPPAVEPEELLDWDACIEVDPPRPTRRIRVTLRDLGRDKPLPVEDPRNDV